MREGSWRPGATLLGGGGVSVHEDILCGRDAEMGWEDVYTEAGRVGAAGSGGGGVHEEIEGWVGMGRW